MNKVIKISLLITPLLFSGCSIMNDKFSCNLTATDNCLTIDEVNAMTEGKSVVKVQRRTKSFGWQKPNFVENKKGDVDKLWIAPRKDKRGIMHGSSLVFIPSTVAAKA